MIGDRMLKLALVTLGLALSSGCATAITRFGATAPYDHFYVATRMDGTMYREAWHGSDLFHGGPVSFLLLAPLITIDLPVSLVADTLCLPLDAIRYGGLESPRSSGMTRFAVRKLAGNWVLLDRKPVPVCIVEAPTFEATNLLVRGLAREAQCSVDDGFTLLVAARPFQGSHRLAV